MMLALRGHFLVAQGGGMVAAFLTFVLAASGDIIDSPLPLPCFVATERACPCVDAKSLPLFAEHPADETDSPHEVKDTLGVKALALGTSPTRASSESSQIATFADRVKQVNAVDVRLAQNQSLDIEAPRLRVLLCSWLL